MEIKNPFSKYYSAIVGVAGLAFLLRCIGVYPDIMDAVGILFNLLLILGFPVWLAFEARRMRAQRRARAAAANSTSQPQGEKQP